MIAAGDAVIVAAIAEVVADLMVVADSEVDLLAEVFPVVGLREAVSLAADFAVGLRVAADFRQRICFVGLTRTATA
jgi:hypothetical protein